MSASHSKRFLSLTNKQLEIFGLKYPLTKGWVDDLCHTFCSELDVQKLLDLAPKQIGERTLPQFIKGELVQVPWSQLTQDVREIVEKVEAENARLKQIGRS